MHIASTPRSKGPKSDPKFSFCSQGLETNEGVEVPLPGPQGIRRELQSYDPGRARDISRSEFLHTFVNNVNIFCHVRDSSSSIYINCIINSKVL